MNWGCNRAKAAAQGKIDVQIGLDIKKLKILFSHTHKKALGSFFSLSAEKEINPVSSCLLQLQLNYKRLWYEVVTSDRIHQSLELSRPLTFQLTKSSELVFSE